MTKLSLTVDAAEPVTIGADAPVAATLKHYLQLAKPGIVFGNLVSVAGGYFLAARGHIDLGLLFAAIMGVSLVVASGCVFNNYIDRDIDARMQRTQNRVLVRGLVAPFAALIYGGILGVAGLALLGFGANILSALLALSGFIVYVGVYSLYMKRHSTLGTAIGSLSGAMPPVIGYCAVSNHFDLAAVLLLLTFSLWQMPHSYAIAIVYLKDYTAAGIPVMPVRAGVAAAKKRITLYIPVFTLAALSLSVFHYTGAVYFATTALFGLYWFYAALSGYRRFDDRIWARKMFLFSIIGIMALSLMMALDFR